MEKNIKKITNVLKTVNYPGYSRDIVSFGIIKSISIDNNILNIDININTENEETLKTLTNDINDKIQGLFTFNDINIKFNNNSKVDTKNKNIKKIIAVSSCKGGVGKSTIALNLAYQLSKKFKIGLLDLDIYGPSLPTLINYSQVPKLIENKIIPIIKDSIEFMSFGFLNNKNSPTIWRGPMVSRMTSQFFDNVKWGNLDYLILDLPPGTGDIQLTLVQKIALDGALIITTPQQLSNIDVAKGADMFNKVNTPILGIIENMSTYLVNGSIKSSQISELIIDGKKVDIDKNGDFNIELDIFKGDSGSRESERLNIPLLGKISLNPEISESCDIGIPYVQKFPTSLISEQFDNIANKITNEIKKID